MTDDQQIETRAIALVSQSLAWGLISRLTAKGLFTKEESVKLLEGALTSFEEDIHDAPEHRIARVMLEAMASIASKS